MARQARSKSKVLVKTDLKLQPVMVICGPERGLVDAAVHHVRAQALTGAMAELNHDRIAGRGTSPEQILACARTLPLMAPHRLVEVSDGEALGAEALEKIATYAESPAPEAVLLIVAKDVDKRTRAGKAFDRLGCLFRYQHLDEDGVTAFARQRARGIGLELDEEAAVVLTAAVGTELQLVERALEKLQLVVEGDRIEVEHIEQHIAQTRVESIFRLTDAIARGHRGDALEVLGQMLEAREAPLRILATLAWQQRQLIRARSLLDDGVASGEVLREVKVFRHGDRFLRQVRAMPQRRVTAGLLVISRADRTLKSSRARPRAVMERTVLELAGLR